MVAPLATDLQSLEPGVNLETSCQANGSSAMTYNILDLLHGWHQFQTPRGQTIQRPTNQYQRFSAISYGEQLFLVADNAPTEGNHQTNIARPPSSFKTPPPMRVQSYMAFSPALTRSGQPDDEVNQAAASHGADIQT